MDQLRITDEDEWDAMDQRCAAEALRWLEKHGNFALHAAWSRELESGAPFALLFDTRASVPDDSRLTLTWVSPTGYPAHPLFAEWFCLWTVFDDEFWPGTISALDFEKAIRVGRAINDDSNANVSFLAAPSRIRPFSSVVRERASKLDTERLSARVSPYLLEQIDAWAHVLQEERGEHVTRSQLVRELLAAGLDRWNKGK